MTRSEIKTQPFPVTANRFCDDPSSMISAEPAINATLCTSAPDVGHASGATRPDRGRQSRKMSFLESMTNVVVGYVLAILTQILVFPWFGIEAGFGEHLTIGLAFIFVSLVRGYVLRRVFEHAQAR